MPAHHIKIVLNEAYMKRFLSHNIKRFFPGAKKITSFYSKHQRLFSEESFLVRYKIGLLMANGKTITKILRGNRVKPETFRIMRFFYNHFTKQKRRVIARPLAYLKKLGFILYEEYDGRTLREFDHNVGVLKKTIPVIARQLAEIHNASPKLGTIRNARDEKEYFSLLSKKVKRCLPTISQRFNQYTRQYLQKFNSINHKGHLLLNHGDFQVSNIIYNSSAHHIGFIDFTSAVRTSPANDVATFLTHARAMLCFLSPRKKIDQLERLFLKNYFTKANKKVSSWVKKDLATYQVRICLDIITTTVVFAEHDKNPHLAKITGEMFSRAQRNLYNK